MDYFSIADQLESEDITCPCTGKTEFGEDVIIEHFCDDGGPYYQVTTVQHNDWLRINRYYEDGVMTETYER